MKGDERGRRWRASLTLAALGATMLGPMLAPPAIVPGAQPEPRLLFRIPEHDLYPESIAYDPASGDYFLGSMSHSRILRIRPDGSYRDFVTPPLPGLQGAIGMKVDAGRRRLWVCTGRYTMFAGGQGAPPRTGVLLFDLDDGTVLGQWLMDQPSPGHIFNDLEIASDGSAYATTTLFGRVYRATAESDGLELVLETPDRHNNGITFDPDGRHLFLTVDRSISRLDLETRELVALEYPNEAALGTDGLYFHDGSLIAVKPRALEIDRLRLDPSRGAIVGRDVLTAKDPDYAYPTTGVMVGDTLVFVGTSFADRPRTAGRRAQHGDVLIYALPIE